MIKKLMSFFFEEDVVTASQFEEEEEVFEDVPKQAVKEEPVFYEVAQRPSTFIDLEEQPAPARMTKEMRVDKKERRTEKMPAPEYVFTSVISPIFGMSSDDQKPIPVATYAAAKTEIPKESLLGTIISPIYGKVNQISSNENVLIVSLRDQPLPPMVELDDLIAGTHSIKEEESSQSHQFSLFDVEDSLMEETLQNDLKSRLDAYGIREFFDEKTK